MQCYRKLSGLVVLLAAAGCGNAYLEQEPPARRFRFELRAELPAGSAGAQETATLWLPVPVADEAQLLGRLRPKAVGGTPVEGYDQNGNRILSVRGTPPLRLSYAISVERFRVRRQPSDQENGDTPEDSLGLVAPRLAPPATVRRDSIYWTAGETRILAKARILYDRVLDSVRFATPDVAGLGRGDLAWIREQHIGDSVDFATLLVAHCQSLGIPAMIEFGWRLPETIAKTPVELSRVHAWTRIYVPGMGWLEADPAAARTDPEKRNFYFGSLDEHRIRLSRGRDIRLQPAQHAQPLNFFAKPYAEVAGRDAHERVRWTARFRDILDAAPARK